MDLEHINGQMVQFMKVSLKMDLDTEKESGIQMKLNILEIILKV